MRVDTSAKKLIKMWVDGVPVEASALQQLRNIANMPFIHKHVAVMPDVHYGIGATVGSVIATTKAIIPAAVGVDIGCGMVAVMTNLRANDLPDNLHAVRTSIEEAVPVGFNAHPDNQHLTIGELGSLLYPSSVITEDLIQARQSPMQQLGTLGGGNHFIELCLDEMDRVWIMLHSGSRGIGNRIGQKYIGLAKEEMAKCFIDLPDVDLAYLVEGGAHFNDYCEAVAWAQKYASANRKVILRLVVAALCKHFPHLEVDTEGRAICCHHNYVSTERHFGQEVLVTRKGAVSAQVGQLGIIPGSMGAKSFIVRGKGNPESFCSCSHGAGRSMSRGEAKRKLTVADHEAATVGVECRKDIGVLDESPQAYKDIDAVMEAQSDLVEIVHTLKQFLCVKG